MNESSIISKFVTFLYSLFVSRKYYYTYTLRTWFEYDDEKVTVLKGGPTCSYDNGENLEKAKGTSDAYNLFYVQKDCLRESITAKFHKNKCFDKGAIQTATTKRETKYAQRLE